MIDDSKLSFRVKLCLSVIVDLFVLLFSFLFFSFFLFFFSTCSRSSSWLLMSIDHRLDWTGMGRIEAADDSDTGIGICGWILTILCWLLVLVTMPFSFFICFKVSTVHILFYFIFLFPTVLSTQYQTDPFEWNQFRSGD
jgi:hypothetical protein